MGFENSDLWDAMKGAKYRQTTEELRDIMMTSVDLNVAVERALDLVCKSSHAAVGTFWVYNQYGDGLIHAKASFGGNSLENIHLFPGEGIAGEVIDKGRSTIVQDCQKDERWANRIDQTTGFITKTMICAPLKYKNVSFACIQLINRKDSSLYDDKDLWYAEELANIIVECLVERGLISEFAFEIVSSKNTAVTEGKIVNASSMFIEICNFTSLVPKIGRDRSTKILDAFLIYISTYVNKNEGYLEKSIGDGMHALWGAPKETTDPSYKAVKAAIEINKNKNELIQKIKNLYDVNLDFSVGIDEGKIFMGVVSQNSVTSFSVVGESVNIASRLCKAAKPGEILISKKAAKEIGEGRFKFEENRRSIVNRVEKSIENYFVDFD